MRLSTREEREERAAARRVSHQQARLSTKKEGLAQRAAERRAKAARIVAAREENTRLMIEKYNEVRSVPKVAAYFGVSASYVRDHITGHVEFNTHGRPNSKE